MRVLCVSCVVLCLVAAAGPAAAADGDLKAVAGAISARHAACIVPVKVVVATKVTYQGREMPGQEAESEILGTVLNDAGVIVASNLSADPAGSLAGMRPDVKVESEIKGAKLVQKDGTEVVLKVVLRDKELDLMFFRPEKAGVKLANVGLKDKGPELALADDILVLSKLGPVGDRQACVSVGRIHAVVDKPRRFYVTDLMSCITAMGCPAFNAKGELVGFVVMRVNQGASGGGLLGGLGSQILPAVLPVADVLEDLKQIEK